MSSLGSMDRAPIMCSGGHRFDSCLGLIILFLTRLCHVKSIHLSQLICTFKKKLCLQETHLNKAKRRASLEIVVSSKYVTISKHLFKYTSERFLHDLCNKMEVLSSNILHNRVQQVQGWQFGLLWNLSDNKNTMLQGSTFRKKTLGPAHSMFTDVVTSTKYFRRQTFLALQAIYIFPQKKTLKCSWISSSVSFSCILFHQITCV